MHRKNLLVAIDFHEQTGLLIDQAFDLARPVGAKVWIVHVSAPDPDFVGYEVGPQYIRDSRAKELREEHRLITGYVNALREKAMDAEGLLIQGPTVKVILTETQKLDIDLIIFGHHPHSPLYTAFFGSTSSELLSRVKVPVLVVPFDC